MSREYQNKIKDYLTVQFNLTEDQINSMIPGLISTLAGHMNKIEEILASGDLEQLGKAGHTMKGAALNLGLGKCAEIACEIEQNGKEGRRDADFSRMVRSMRKIIDKYID